MTKCHKVSGDKMGNMKLGNIKSANHLETSIEYIFNPQKTENGRYIFGDSGTTAEEVRDSFLSTKEAFGKTDGRQAYHFILTFGSDENVKESLAQKIAERFMEKYFPADDYDWTAAVHNDKDHMHVHIIFNSVNRITGYKYRYENGDWEEQIQKIVDGLCSEYDLKTIMYEFDKEGKETKKEKPKKYDRAGTNYEKHNPEIKSKADIIRQDIDRYISESDSYHSFLKRMIRDGYKVHEGRSEKYGEYLTLTPYGVPKGMRTYRLGEKYTVTMIRERIKSKEKLMDDKPLTGRQYARLIRIVDIHPVTYRKWYAKHIYIARVWKNKQPFEGSFKYKRDIINARKLLEEYNQLKTNDYKTVSDIKMHIRKLSSEMKALRRLAENMAEDCPEYKQVEIEIREVKRQMIVADRISKRIETEILYDKVSQSQGRDSEKDNRSIVPVKEKKG